MHPQMTGGMGPLGGPGSMYGGVMGVPRNSVMTNLNMFGGGPGSIGGGPASTAGGLGTNRPLSTFSVDPFGGTGPSPSENPTDDEILAVFTPLPEHAGSYDSDEKDGESRRRSQVPSGKSGLPQGLPESFHRHHSIFVVFPTSHLIIDTIISLIITCYRRHSDFFFDYVYTKACFSSTDH